MPQAIGARLLGYCNSVRPEGGAEAEAPYPEGRRLRFVFLSRAQSTICLYVFVFERAQAGCG